MKVKKRIEFGEHLVATLKCVALHTPPRSAMRRIFSDRFFLTPEGKLLGQQL